MSKHLRLEQRLGERRAVHGHERFAAAAAVGVDELRNQFFAGAARAGDEHRRIGRRHATREIDRLAEYRRHPQDLDAIAVTVLARELRLLLLRFERDAYGVDRAADENLEMCRRERLGEIVPRAQPQRLDARCDARVSRHHDDERLGARL